MNAMRVALLLAVGALMLATHPARADGDAGRMEAMEARLMALEDKLEASNATIEAQREMLELSSAPAVSEGYALDSFLNGLEFGGHITGSYIYNFNSPGAKTGTQPLCQFNCNHDEFSFDAAKLEIGKPVPNPGDFGFQLDLLFGQNSTISRSLSPTGAGFDSPDSDNGVFVQQAYVSANIRGAEVKFGNWETLLGWELIDSHKNYNITHGILFTWAIPLYHTGIIAGGSIGETGIGWNFGLANGFNNTFDTNSNKGFLGLLSYETGPLFASLSWFLGSEKPETLPGASRFPLSPPGPRSSSDDLLIFDFVASLDFEPLFLWLNFDWGEQEDAVLTSLTAPMGTTIDDSDYWGIAIGANYSFTDKLSFALRGEYWEDDDDVRGAGGLGGFEGADVEIYSLTGTLKYQLSENAYIRGELRYDKSDDDTLLDGQIFPDDSSAGFDDSELFGIVEVSYVFD